ncbi:MAG: hypothetical protein M3R63_23575 [Actinomycetota bacterium]|nr:hypothetical protein [Actinomycetota bacterium]
MSENSGVMNTGTGTINISGSAIGDRATANNGSPPLADRESPRVPRTADVGVLTILSEEMRAVIEILRRSKNYRQQEEQTGLLFHRATVHGVRVVAMQALKEP